MIFSNLVRKLLLWMDDSLHQNAGDDNNFVIRLVPWFSKRFLQLQRTEKREISQQHTVSNRDVRARKPSLKPTMMGCPETVERTEMEPGTDPLANLYHNDIPKAKKYAITSLSYPSFPSAKYRNLKRGKFSGRLHLPSPISSCHPPPYRDWPSLIKISWHTRHLQVIIPFCQESGGEGKILLYPQRQTDKNNLRPAPPGASWVASSYGSFAVALHEIKMKKK